MEAEGGILSTAVKYGIRGFMLCMFMVLMVGVVDGGRYLLVLLWRKCTREKGIKGDKAC